MIQGNEPHVRDPKDGGTAHGIVAHDFAAALEHPGFGSENREYVLTGIKYVDRVFAAYEHVSNESEFARASATTAKSSYQEAFRGKTPRCPWKSCHQ